jgi:hypothetical protein
MSLPVKLANAVGLPVLIAGTAGVALLLRRRPRAGGGLAAAGLGASLASAGVLTAAGMPVVERYLLVPLMLLVVLAAGAATEVWDLLRRPLPARSTTAGARNQGPGRGPAIAAMAGLGVLVVLLCSVPGRLGTVAAQRARLAAQATLRADLRALAIGGGLPSQCARVAASNHKLIPLLALWTGRAPASFGAAGPAEAYVEPATAAAQRTLLVASSDPPEAAPAPPAGAVEVARNDAWRIESQC